MSNRVNTDVVAGGVVFVLAAVYLIAAFQIPPSSFGTAGGIGPKDVPVLIGFALVAMSLGLVLKGLLEGRSETAERDSTPESPEEAVHSQDPRKFVVVVLLLLGYILAFIPLGYIPSTFLFVLSTTMFLDRKHWVRNLVYALVFPVIVYAIFTQLLAVRLPAGVLG